MARVQADHGRLDLLVNNASAFGQTPDGYPLEDTPSGASPSPCGTRCMRWVCDHISWRRRWLRR
jgi:hypothetical protein